MSLKSKVLAAVAALALVGGVSLAGAVPAHAGTQPCGRYCLDPFSRLYGTHKNPAFVLDVFRQGNKVGQPVILFRASNTDPAEDFTVSLTGTVADFYAAGLVSQVLDLRYSKLEAYEIQYSPYGVDSGLCVGLPTAAANGTKVSLQPCGQSANTVWVVDSSASIHGSYVPLVSGSDTNFTTPYVLTYPVNSHPTGLPRPQLVTRPLATYSDGTVDDDQLWSADLGVMP